ncbi:hypothetical protein Golax_010531 [Gossypium laxum]|uniref:Transposase MuDR plant domain-containing protein n=1 Tax=Gossypium laxum TaxID=34288 RepID=A0A7J8ZHZ8_9ROSI|nr:hypothetical protein [Gossypium laxum]
MCVIGIEPLVEQDNNASHVYENDDFGAGEGVVLGAIEGSNEGDCEEDGKGVGQGAFEADGKEEDVDWQYVDEVYMERTACELENDVWEDVEVQERHDKSTQEANGYEIDYFESNDHGSIVESSSEEKHEHGARRRKKFSVYNPNYENPKFCLGMLFRDGETFKDVIQNYSKVSRRELKIVTNEPKWIRVKCITFAKCPWRISASYNKRSKSLQCRRAKKRMNKRVAGSFKEEFAMLWDYADELRVKNPDSTIKMAMHRFGRKKAKFYEFDFWEIVKATTEREWEDNCKFDMVDNNICEAFNSSIVEPINGTHEWVKFGIEPVLPPIDKKMPGRPKKNRRNPKDEPDNDM